MSEETFSPEYFQHLLSSLTLNSRALIVELTGLAERFTDNAQEIVQLIEERINKILPKYKLYSFYLMDSIIKNIGNPYNLMFATNLYKNFTETYLIIDDTPTRQNMINLFKTWVCGKTSAGLDLFPKDTLLKVEKFIIQATSLSTPVQPDTSRVTRDMILRESNYLLQYVIALDEDLEKLIEFNSSDKDTTHSLRVLRLARNDLILEINVISEAALMESRDEFESTKDKYVERLQGIRKEFDAQALTQQNISKETKQPPPSPKEVSDEATIIEFNFTPKQVDILTLLEDALDPSFEAAIQEWGKDQVVATASVTYTEEQMEESNAQPVLSQDLVHPPESSAVDFGQQIDTQGLPGLPGILSEDYVNELTFNLSGASFEDEGDGYDPELTLNESEIKHSPPTSPINGTFQPGKSSLKRPYSGDERKVKRVRFED